MEIGGGSWIVGEGETLVGISAGTSLWYVAIFFTLLGASVREVYIWNW